ncbi:hypothetical protein [Sulfurivermis fontis]|jgi:hypothetical protein|uniref:hypothetical protein n=1 Tax=Sulfurivermis fontis TaxID=1972068 RepID=UPI000FDA7ECC|nr:hypothetical protein [Sulfurivermis fontis]
MTLLLACGAPLTAAPLWWSETNPHAEHGDARHSHGGPVEIRRGVYYKNLWLRSGDGPANSAYVDQLMPGRLLLQNVKGDVVEMSGGNLHGSFGVNFAMPDEGFYNLYLISEFVSDGVRHIGVAKSEVLKHSCREGHDHIKPLIAPRTLDTLPLEIVRERQMAENFHTLLGYGDTVTFQIRRQGQPLADAEVTFHTAQGWHKTVRSDAAGHASFMLVRDYYPDWHEFERRYRQDYMVSAAYSVTEDGMPTRYVATYNGSYYPSTRDYRSYAYGLLLGTFALTFTGVAVYLYRRRRQRRFHEVRFDEKN